MNDTPVRIEPCHIESLSPQLADLVAELVTGAERLGQGLHPRTAASLANLVRIMNCYYSNLIEGHDTKPRDIERALANELDREEGQRNLQVEARALLTSLVEDGILGSDTPKGAVSLRFPVKAVEILFPRLFPET